METKLWMSILLFLATALMLLFASLCYRKRHLPVTRTMILTMRLWFNSAPGIGTSFSFTLPGFIDGRNALASREWEANHG